MVGSLARSAAGGDQRQGARVVAVIPAYNEESTIGSVVLVSLLHTGQVIVVDDGSTDNTAAVAKMAGAEVIRLARNSGKAAAVFAGIDRAKSSLPDAVVLLDADGQHLPEEIPDVVRPVLLGKADLVIGSRFLKKKNAIPTYRRVGQKTIDFVANIGAETKTTDSQSGFRALSAYALDHMDFVSEGYNIESDMFQHFLEHGLRICEAPVTVRYEVNHSHKANPLAHGFDVLSNLIGIIGYRRPLITFGVPGMAFVIAGLLCGFVSFSEYYDTTKFPFGMSMISMLFLILGPFLIMTGLILNSIVWIVNHRDGDVKL